jgi:chromosome partitioning protein
MKMIGNLLIRRDSRPSAVAKFMNSCQAGLSHRGVRFGGSTMAGTTWFDIIALATSKGGVGKSTLARGLAAHWFALGRKPALIDADPTATLSKRYNPQGKLGAVPVIAEPEELVAEVIEKLRARHTPVIVDTAGFRNRTTISALVAADLAIIPLKPAAEDLDCAVATYDLIREINETPERSGHPIRTAMILTMTMRGTVIARHVRNQLEAAGYPLLQAEMPHRVAYPEAGIEGLSPSVTDPDGAAARDIAAIVHELLDLQNHESMKSSDNEVMKKVVGA